MKFFYLSVYDFIEGLITLTRAFPEFDGVIDINTKESP